MIARSPRPGSGRGGGVPPRPGVPAEGPQPPAGTGGGSAGQQSRQSPGKRSICPGCPRLSPAPRRFGRSVPHRLPRTGAALPSPVPAADPGTAGPARAEIPGGAGPRGESAARGHPAPRQAPPPPIPGTPRLGEVINPTPPTAPTVMFVTACPSLGVERSMTSLCCLNKNQWQLKGENSSY